MEFYKREKRAGTSLERFVIYCRITNKISVFQNLLNFSFISLENQSVVGKVCQETKSTHPGTTESEITGKIHHTVVFSAIIVTLYAEACKVYFKSLKDDENRRHKGKHEMHRRSLKLTRRSKQVRNIRISKLCTIINSE